jgi:hypothetical protein
VDPQFSPEQVEDLLPLAAAWASEQEGLVLRDGMPLSAQQMTEAKRAGVVHPERVRILHVETIPVPAHPVLQAACSAINFVAGAPQGLTFNYGIFVRCDRVQDRHLLLHELAHTSQYERLGGIVPFLRKYIWECLTFGYQSASLELEADKVAERVLKSASPKPENPRKLQISMSRGTPQHAAA